MFIELKKLQETNFKSLQYLSKKNIIFERLYSYMEIKNFNLITGILDEIEKTPIILLIGEENDGKSKLLQEIKLVYKNKKLSFGQAEKYFFDYIDSLMRKQHIEYIQNLIKYDILMIDDFQFLKNIDNVQKMLVEVIEKRSNPTIIALRKEYFLDSIFIAELEKLVSNAIKFEIIKTDDNIDIKPL